MDEHRRPPPSNDDTTQRGALSLPPFRPTSTVGTPRKRSADDVKRPDKVRDAPLEHAAPATADGRHDTARAERG
jgi:hypothetical protein